MCSTNVDHAQGACFPERVQAALVAQRSIGQELADLQIGKPRAQLGKTERKDFALIGVGRMQVGANGPGTGEAVVEDAVRVGSIAVDVSPFVLRVLICLPSGES